MNFQKITDLPIDMVSGKKVLVRLDLNVPIQGGMIADDFRIKKAEPLLLWLSKVGAKVVILSHLEDVYSKEGGLSSNRPVFDYLKQKFNIRFAETIKEAQELKEGLALGEMFLLENLRFDKREKDNDKDFAKELSTLGDIYVNEAFSASHRAHTSIVGVPKLLPSYAGPLFASEVINLSRVENPDHPFLFVLGGAKFESKLPLIEKFVKIADKVMIAGALANDFFKSLGYEIGNSKVYGKIDLSSLSKNPKILLPVDVVVWSDAGSVVKLPEEVLPTDIIEDIGPKSLEMLAPILGASRFILWNGPLGNYEKGFRDRTVKFAEMISDAEGFSIIGGGDTTAVISHMDFESKFGFVSTGGGAMLEFLEKGTLPGIEALKKTA